MRLLGYMFILILTPGITAGKYVSTDDKGTSPWKLNGTWLPVKQEFGGKLLPASVYEKQKLVISDSIYTFIAESIDKGIVKYTETQMDIYGKDGVNAGKHFTAIYKFENDELTICYNLTGESYPEEFETKSKAELFLAVFKKIQ